MRDEIIEFAELESFLDMPVKRYSSGMLARLGFALATSVEADLFVVDEVLSVGDWGFQRRSLERMRHLNNQGAAILFVSHNLWIVSRCASGRSCSRRARSSIGPANQVIGQYVGQTPYLNDLPDEVLARSPEGIRTAADDAGELLMRSPSTPYEIGELIFDPPEVSPGGSVTLRTTIEVRHPDRGRPPAGRHVLGGLRRVSRRPTSCPASASRRSASTRSWCTTRCSPRHPHW